LLEVLQSLASVGLGLRAESQSPPAHDEIAGIGVGRLFLIDPSGCIAHKLDVERRGDPTRDLVLRCRVVGAIGIEPVCPQMRTALDVGQLHVYPNPITSPRRTLPSRT
jgi:hypothetical protein